MIYFYNTFHNGDVHYSRSFVRDIMNKIGDNEYCYLHNNNPDILKDIQNLKHDKSFSTFDNWNLVSSYPISYFNQVIKNSNDIFINTWVGQQNWITKDGINRNRDMRYCSLYSLYELYQDIYNTLDIKIENIEYYLPYIDFKYIEKSNIENFIEGNKYRLKILLVNNEPRTVRIPMNFEHVVDILSTKYSDILFILTKNNGLQKSNVAYTSDIIKLNSDLNEIAYLSKFCDIIVGRPSGPYCFTMIVDNFNNHKTFITISENKYDSFYFESVSNMLLLTDHSTNGLMNLLEKQII
jgi:hypothetical protein